MGWVGSGDTDNQVRLHFDTREEAVAYAEANGLAYEVEEPKPHGVPAQILRRQLPLRPHGQLDALTAAGQTGEARGRRRGRGALSSAG